MNDILKVDCNFRDFDPNSLFYYIISLNDNTIFITLLVIFIKLWRFI